MTSLYDVLGSRGAEYIGFQVTVRPAIAFVWVSSPSLEKQKNRALEVTIHVNTEKKMINT